LGFRCFLVLVSWDHSKAGKKESRPAGWEEKTKASQMEFQFQNRSCAAETALPFFSRLTLLWAFGSYFCSYVMSKRIACIFLLKGTEQ
jgi:hypothetical protein